MMNYSIFEIRDFCFQHLYYIDAQVKSGSLSQEKFTELYNYLYQIYLNPRLVSKFLQRGEYMGIEKYICSKNKDLSYMLQNGRSRNTADVFMISSLINHIIFINLKRSKALLGKIYDLASYNKYLRIEAFTQGQYSGIMLFSSLILGFYKELSDIHHRMITILNKPFPYILYAGPGHGSNIAHKYFTKLENIYYFGDQIFIPQQSLGNTNYISEYFSLLDSYALAILKIANTLKVYTENSNILSCSMQWGKSSAIPNKKNLYQFERLHILANSLHNINNGLFYELANCGLYNEYRSKNYFRQHVKDSVKLTVKIQNLFNQLISSIKLTECDPNVKASFYEQAEYISIKKNLEFRSAYNFIENTSNDNYAKNIFKTESINSVFLSQDYHKEVLGIMDVLNEHMHAKTKISFERHYIACHQKHNFILKSRPYS